VEEKCHGELADGEFSTPEESQRVLLERHATEQSEEKKLLDTNMNLLMDNVAQRNNMTTPNKPVEEKCDREHCASLTHRGKNTCTGTTSYEDLNGNIEDLGECPCICHAPTPISVSWEEAFDNEFDSYWNPDTNVKGTARQIKAFIRQVEARAREEAEERAKRNHFCCKYQTVDPEDWCDYCLNNFKPCSPN
jgi:hypothetical protein